jgi:hypothetical protein
MALKLEIRVVTLHCTGCKDHRLAILCVSKADDECRL